MINSVFVDSSIVESYASEIMSHTFSMVENPNFTNYRVLTLIVNVIYPATLPLQDEIDIDIDINNPIRDSYQQESLENIERAMNIEHIMSESAELFRLYQRVSHRSRHLRRRKLMIMTRVWVLQRQ